MNEKIIVRGAREHTQQFKNKILGRSIANMEEIK